MEEMTFITAAKKHFGFKPGQSISTFMEEIKALTPEDKEYMKKEFLKVGIKITN